MSIKERSGY